MDSHEFDRFSFDRRRVSPGEPVFLVKGKYDTFADSFNSSGLPEFTHLLMQYRQAHPNNDFLGEPTVLVGPPRGSESHALPSLVMFPHSHFSPRLSDWENEDPWLKADGWRRIYYGEKETAEGIREESKQFPYIAILDAILRSRRSDSSRKDTSTLLENLRPISIPADPRDMRYELLAPIKTDPPISSKS